MTVQYCTAQHVTLRQCEKAMKTILMVKQARTCLLYKDSTDKAIAYGCQTHCEVTTMSTDRIYANGPRLQTIESQVGAHHIKYGMLLL